ncbi:hypothetical protein N878_28055, partial [Pseudomonas sp. EGD-AK9]
TFFKWFWSVVNKFFSFFQAKTSDFTYNFDNFDFLRSCTSKDKIEFALLFSSSASSSSASYSYRSSSSYAKFFFDCFY